MQENFSGRVNITIASYPADIIINWVGNKTQNHNITNLDDLDFPIDDDSKQDLAVLKESFPHINEVYGFPSG
jgi:hypothetical protein